MVIIIVVAVPEGLPMSVTVSLALAMRKMTRANSPGPAAGRLRDDRLGHGHLLRQDRHADAEQDAGGPRSAGTARRSTAARRTGRSPSTHRPWPRDGKPLDWIALNAAVNSTANLEEKEGKLVTVGNSTEGALLQWLREAGVEYRQAARCSSSRSTRSTSPPSASA